MKNFKEKEGIDLSGDIQALQRLTEAAEKAKMELSTVEKTTISLPFITADQTGPKHIDEELNKVIFTAESAKKTGLRVNAGHDLDLDNLVLVKDLNLIDEVSIGHAIISESLNQGFKSTIRQYIDLIDG